MAKPFRGVINVDVTQSVPDWEPYTQPIAPEGTPNVLYIVLDDVGYSAMGPYGGLIETPNIDRIAGRGLTYTSFHTTALCSPTRSCLMTGRNHTTNGMATITEAASGVPELERAHPVRVRHDRGGAGRTGLEYLHGGQVAPDRRGRDEPGLAEEPVAGRTGIRAVLRLSGRGDQPVVPGPGLRQPPGRAAQVAGGGLPPDRGPDRQGAGVHPRRPGGRPGQAVLPVLLPRCLPRPHHAPKEWIDRYRGKFDMGYEAYREQVYERQKRMGVITDKAELSPVNPYIDATSTDGKGWPELDTVRPWDSLTG